MPWAQRATRLKLHVACLCDSHCCDCAGLRAQPVPAGAASSICAAVGAAISIRAAAVRPGNPCAGPDSRAHAEQLCAPGSGACRCSVHSHPPTMSLHPLPAPRSAGLPYLALPSCSLLLCIHISKTRIVEHDRIVYIDPPKPNQQQHVYRPEPQTMYVSYCTHMCHTLAHAVIKSVHIADNGNHVAVVVLLF